MSGFEIVGVVLGAIPLFISVAEHYRDGLDTVDKFLKKERILKLYIQELELHDSLLRLQLQVVIGSTDLPAKIQQELVDDAISPLWQREDVQAQLHQSLGDMADILQKTMKRMADVFIEQIDTDHTTRGHYQYKINKVQTLRRMVAQSQGSKSSWVESFSERVKFTWKSSKRNEILIDLRSCNDNLFKLVNAAEEARPYQKKQQVRKVHAAWQSRTESQRLFDVLTSTCICSCQPFHRAKLRIKPCTNDDENVEYSCMLFNISFQRTLSSECAITVNMYRKRLDLKSTGVRIASTGLSNLPDKRRWKPINDICAAVEAVNNCNKHIALAIDELKDLWETEDLSTLTPPPANPDLSLEALFPIFTPIANKKWLVREKLILAVILAYSTLQLHDSRWLQPGFSSRHLFFSKHGANFSAATAAGGAGITLGEPYISSDVWGIPQTSATTSRIHSNNNLLSLGIMLLELHLNESLQPHNSDQGSLKLRAMDLLQEHYEDCSLSPCYYEAVRFCLFPKPDPSTRLIEFSDQGFREVYYRNVILPLEEELNENFEIGQNFWDDL